MIQSLTHYHPPPSRECNITEQLKFCDEEDYENAVVQHMLKCSATPAAHNKPLQLDAEKETPFQIREEDLDKKPAARTSSASSDTPTETTTEGDVSSGKDERVTLSSPFVLCGKQQKVRTTQSPSHPLGALTHLLQREQPRMMCRVPSQRFQFPLPIY
jgi:hypothetical protein